MSQAIIKENISDPVGDRYFGSDTIFSVEIRKNESIRVFGSRSGKAFDITFRMGDLAEYDSYNLSYCGKIVGIGEKTVTIVEPYFNAPKRHRLNLYKFAWRNYDFDLAAIQKRNSEWSD